MTRVGHACEYMNLPCTESGYWLSQVGTVPPDWQQLSGGQRSFTSLETLWHERSGIKPRATHRQDMLYH